MDKKQKKMLFSIFIILLLIVLLIGYTFAKYYSNYNGTASTNIAKWNFKVTGWSTTETKQISLINTANVVSLADGKIAPGAGGEFEIELDARGSEVNVKYDIETTETGNKPSNILFSVKRDGEPVSQTYSSLGELANAELSGVIPTSGTQIEKLKIIWDWPYQTGDENDIDEIAAEDGEDTAFGMGTVNGKENVFNYSFSMKVIGTQAKV